MNILLINSNPVVSRLISLCMRDDGMELEEVSDVSDVKLHRYDAVFVDDASYDAVAHSLIEDLMVKRRVYLSGKKIPEECFEGFDEVLSKPFLPSQINTIITQIQLMEEEVEVLTLAVEKKQEMQKEGGKDSFIFPLHTETEHQADIEEEVAEEKVEDISDLLLEETTSVLDESEIEKIKALLKEEKKAEEKLPSPLDEVVDYESRKVEVITEHLQADGLEIVNEDEIVELFSNTDESETDEKKEKKHKIHKSKNSVDKKKKEKSKKEKDKKEKDKKEKNKKNKKEDIYTFEETLIAAIEGMKVKKIKKLLKGAKVNISVHFKDKK